MIFSPFISLFTSNPANICSKLYLELLTSVIPVTSTLDFQATLISHPACSDSLISLLLLRFPAPTIFQAAAEVSSEKCQGHPISPLLKTSPAFLPLHLEYNQAPLTCLVPASPSPNSSFPPCAIFLSVHQILYLPCWCVFTVHGTGATQRHFHKSLW